LINCDQNMRVRPDRQSDQTHPGRAWSDVCSQGAAGTEGRWREVRVKAASGLLHQQAASQYLKS
jgi:hypothetical protein